MEPIKTLAASWLFAGAVVAFIWAATGLIRNGRNAGLSAYFVAACGVWLLAGYRLLAIPASPYSWISLAAVPFIFSIGPALYFWIRKNLNSSSGHWIHWGWVPVSLLLAGILNFRGADAPESPGLLWILFTGSKAVTMGYLLAVLSSMFWLSEIDMRRRFRGLIWLCVVAFLSLLLGLLGSVPGLEILRLISALSLPAIIIAGFLFSLIHPDIVHSLKEEIQIRYARSKLLHLDVDAIEQKLTALMEQERPYLDEDFNLQSMARELELSTHQVSEVLNSRMGCSFSDLVNGYRIRAALQMLREERDRSILSIGLAVGFNSRSSFHRSFKKHTGKTPQMYRAENMAESGR